MAGHHRVQIRHQRNPAGRRGPRRRGHLRGGTTTTATPPETLGRIQAQGAAVYRTDYEGHIIFTAPEGEES